MKVATEVREIVASATLVRFVLGGATHSDMEFHKALNIGDSCAYELLFVPRSLRPVLVEKGIGRLAAQSVLERVDAVPLLGEEIMFEANDGAHGMYYVRVASRGTRGRSSRV